jgi:predicted transcriptional regulator
MDIVFTDRELDIMAALWDAGEATVADVRAHVRDELAYTTVQTMLRILEEKGYVAHREEGRAHVFYPLVEREAAGTSALDRLRRKIFGGSAELLLTHVVADRDLRPDELRRMQALLEARLREREED